MFIEDFEETREDFDEKMEGKLLRRNNSWKVLFRSDRALVSRIKRRRFFVMSYLTGREETLFGPKKKKTFSQEIPMCVNFQRLLQYIISLLHTSYTISIIFI
jgi:hypothetical protein